MPSITKAERAEREARLAQGLWKCSRCEETKPVDQFYKCAAKWSGVSNRCQPCDRAYKADNQDHIREREREYRLANQDSIRAQRHAYRQANREQRLEYGRQRHRFGGGDPDRFDLSKPITYKTAHTRVCTTYGSASRHECVDADRGDCKGQHQWSYDHNCPHERSEVRQIPTWNNGEPVEVRFSPDPSRYQVRCRKHHRLQEREMVSA